MYNQFFGLSTNCFNMTPDPAFLLLTPQHREVLAGLAYAVLERKGFVLLTGDVGTGKTTLLSRTLQYLPADRIHCSVILNPTLTPSEFLEMALLNFGIQNVPASKAQRLMILQELLATAQKQGKSAVLAVDDAHRLSPDVLEEIRLLGNFEMADQKLLQIVLIGQNELVDLLNRVDLRQFKQRIALRLSLTALGSNEVEQYVRHRWVRGGGSSQPPFSAEALREIAAWSHGIPRLINVICDNALLSAFGQGVSVVTARHVLDAATELKLSDPAQRPAAVQAPLKVQAAAPVPASVPLKTAAPGSPLPPPVQPVTIRTLDRYTAQPAKPSLLTRFAGMLRMG
jgi:general secretion pathway protein A